MRSLSCAARSVMLAGPLLGQSPSAPSADSSPSIQLESMTVDAARVLTPQPGGPPVDPFRASHSLTVLDSRFLRTQAPRSLNDTINFVPGLAVNSPVAGGFAYYERGFRQNADNIRLDGFAGIAYAGGYSPSLFGIEEIVFTRGPANLLFGAASAPGGTINLVSARPRVTPQQVLSITAETYAGQGIGAGERNSLTTMIDTTGPLSSRTDVLYRAIVARSQFESFTTGVRNDTHFASVALSFPVDSARHHVLTPRIQYVRETRAAGEAEIISPSTSLSTRDGKSGPVNFGDVSPHKVNLGGGGRTDEQLVAGLDYSGAVSPALSIRAAYRHTNTESGVGRWLTIPTTLLQATPNDARSWTIRRRRNESQTERVSDAFGISADWRPSVTSNWETVVSAGYDFKRNRETTSHGTGAAQSPINIYTGVAPALRDDVVALTSAPDSDYVQHNLRVQDQISTLDRKWILTLGAGYSSLSHRSAPATDQVIPEVGLLHQPRGDLVLYASYASAYQAADPTFENSSGARNLFSPTRGHNLEVGLRHVPSATAAPRVEIALFETTRDRVLIRSSPGDLNPNGHRFFSQQDGQTTRGIEVSAAWEPVPSIKLKLAAAKLDARYDTGPAALRSPVAKTPPYSATIDGAYVFAPRDANSFTLGSTLVWIDRRLGGNAAPSAADSDPLLLPAVLRLDLRAAWQLSARTRIALHVRNATGTRDVLEGATGAELVSAEPRRISLQLTVSL